MNAKGRMLLWGIGLPSAIIAALWAGLAWYQIPKDITADSRYPTDYVKDQIYILKADVFYDKTKMS